MTTTGKREITDAELGLALKNGVSLDKYVEVRRRLDVSPTRARTIASIDRLWVEDYEEALEQGLRYGQIVGLTQGKYSLRAIINLMKSGATLDEAYEACEACVPTMGSYSYSFLRNELKVSHREIIRVTDIGREAGVIRQQFLEYVFGLKLDESIAVKAAESGLLPTYYLAATISFDMCHQEIMDRCQTPHETRDFERELHDIQIAKYRSTMAALRQ